MPNEDMDVNTVEETTIDSSTEEQTADTNEDTSDQSVEDNTEAGAESNVEESKGGIPRDRFNKAIEKERSKYDELRKEFETLKSQLNKTPEDPVKQQQTAEVKQQLKELGFMTKEEFEAERNRAKEDDFVKSELSRLESTYNGKDGKPKFDRQEVIEYALDNKIGDPEAAFLKMNHKAIIDSQVRAALNKTRGVKTETSDGSGSAQVGTSNKDLKTAAMKGDKNALNTLLKRQFKVNN